MPKYNQFYYSTEYYGTRAALAYSAMPMSATALDYTTVQVGFTVPTGQYSEFRLVRSQLGFPQTQEDGAIVYSYSGPPTSTEVLDTSDRALAPLVPGRFVFYRVWVRRSDSNYWVQAGDAVTLVPSSHPLTVGKAAVYSGAGKDGLSTTDLLVSSNPTMRSQMYDTHERFLDSLPRVVTSASNSGVDVVEHSYASSSSPSGASSNSLLSTFLSAFSFTYDEFLTYISLIYSGEESHWLSPTSVFLGAQQFGMTQDVDSVTVPQRMLLRHAVEIYQKKGTTAGLELFVQSLTGYDCTVSSTRNLLLSHEDATFDVINWNVDWEVGSPDDPIGNWKSLSSGLRLTVESAQAVVPADTSVGPLSIDSTYCLKVSPTASGQKFALGTTDPVVTGIPVTSGLPYTASFYAKNTGVGTVATVEIQWRDRKGLIISTSSGSITLSASSWTRFSLSNKLAPSGAVYATIEVTVNQAYPLYFDLVQFEQGTVATVYQEPRAAVITLNPTKINYLTNPSFENGTTGWTYVGAGTLTAGTYGALGGHGGRMYATSAGTSAVIQSDLIPVTEGEYFTASGYASANAADDTAVSIALRWYNSSLGTMYSETSTGILATKEKWTRDSLSAKAPLGAAFARVVVTALSSISSARTDVTVDALQFELGDTATDYFDGSLTSDGNEWAGNVSGSFTGNYPAKTNRFARLETELPFYLGFDTPFYIYTYQGFYSSGVS